MFSEEPRLGCRSPLVLQKIGYDLRASLDETFKASLPHEMKVLSDRLLGYAEWEDVPGHDRLADKGDTII